MVDFLKMSTLTSNLKYRDTRFIVPKRIAKLYLDKVLKTYRNKESKVTPNHPLVTFIRSIPMNNNLSIWEFDSKIVKILERKTRAYNFTTPYHHGGAQYNILMNDIKTTVDFIQRDVDLININDNWETLKPIRVKTSTYIDFYMTHPSRIELLSGFFNLEICFRTLIHQYRFWKQARIKKMKSSDPAVFIYQYVLTNMIPDIYDMSIINKILDYDEINLYEINRKNKHPFTITNIEKHVDKQRNFILNRFNNRGVFITDFLNSLEVVNADNVIDFLLTDNNKITIQSAWIMYSRNLKYINDIFDILSSRGVKANKHFIIDVLGLIKLNSKNIILDEVNDVIIDDIKYEIELLKSRV